MLDRYRVKALIRSSLNEIAPLVGFVIVFDRRFAVRSRRDHGLDASLGQIGAELTSILIKIVAWARALRNLVRLILLPGPRRGSVGTLNRRHRIRRSSGRQGLRL